MREKKYYKRDYKYVDFFINELLLPYIKIPKKKISKQIQEMIILLRKYKVFPYHYFRMILYRESLKSNIENFIPSIIVRRYRNSLNMDYSYIVDNKLSFQKLFLKNNISTPENILYIDKDGNFMSSNDEYLDYNKAEKKLHKHVNNLFVKPRVGHRGKGAYRLGNRKNDIENLLLNCKDVIIQRLIRQHNNLSEIYPHSINTIRIDTYNYNNEITISSAFLRMGRDGSVIDNLGSGGLMCGIDMNTGRLISPARTLASFGVAEYELHPDTKFPFSNFLLPYWDEIIKLVKDSAKIVEPLRSVGWDVAISEDGPVIVEGNANWEISGSQLIYGIGNTRLGESSLNYWRENKKRKNQKKNMETSLLQEKKS